MTSPSNLSYDPVAHWDQCPRDDYNGSRAIPGSALESAPLTSGDCRPAKEVRVWLVSGIYLNSRRNVWRLQDGQRVSCVKNVFGVNKVIFFIVIQILHKTKESTA